MISIAMATYNGEKYLSLQLQSILQQTIQDLEIVICDDCSTDGTWELLQKFSTEDSRIRCFRNEKNLGFKKNFEKAMLLCTGEFVALSDQDDIWEKDHLETLLNLIRDKDIACGNAHLIGSNGESLGKNLGDYNFFYECPKDYKDIPLRIFYNCGCFQGASMLIRKELLEVALPLPEGVDYHDTWLTVIACYSKGFVYTPQIITQHRRHEANASSTTTWPTYLGFLHIKRNRGRPDRICMAAAVKERLKGKLDQQQLKQLNHVPVYNENRKTKFGNLKNLIFRCMHYNAVYSTTKKFFLEW